MEPVKVTTPRFNEDLINKWIQSDNETQSLYVVYHTAVSSRTKDNNEAMQRFTACMNEIYAKAKDASEQGKIELSVKCSKVTSVQSENRKLMDLILRVCQSYLKATCSEAGNDLNFKLSWRRDNVFFNPKPSFESKPVTEVRDQYFKSLLTDDSMADLIIKVGEKKFNCHKVMLSQSLLFAEKMKNEWRNCGPVSLDGCKPENFEVLREFLYTGLIPNDYLKNEENVSGLFRLAHFVQLATVKGICIQHLYNNINLSNILTVISLHAEIPNEFLKELCLWFIKSHSDDVQNLDLSQLGIFANPLSSSVSDR
jgi:BTB/POZ domain